MTKENKGFTPTIGLEIHAQLNTATKMFCGCRNVSDDGGQRTEDGPNTLTCPICLGLPGALPFANEHAIVKTYLIARAVGCELAQHTHWERKNYFYPDLPKGFQISQYTMPIGQHGNLADITIRRVHLEEDTGKLIHQQGKTKGNKGEQGVTLIDYNRSGVPLVELVTEPEITTAKQAADFAKEYQLALRYLGVSSADMERGQLRVEANVSVAPNSKLKTQKSKFGTKVEIKNLNSFRSVERAIEHEIKRQEGLLQAGRGVVQETRGWNEAKQATFSQRVKETESDYRYFPEPDLPPITDYIKLQVQTLMLPELPQKKRRKLHAIGLPGHYVEVLIADLALLARFETIIKRQPSQAKAVASLLVNRPQTRTMSGSEVIKLAALPDHQLKQVLKGEGVEKARVSPKDFDSVVQEVIKNQSQAVADYRAGKHAVLGFLIGQVVRRLPNADPKLVADELKKML